MSDIGLEAFPGSGTAEDPYVIEGYSIITTNSRGIRITGTTKYFTVRNCYVDAKDYGIYIENVADGTVTVINNSCWGNNNWGIAIHYSSNFTVANNTCNNNYGGIGFYETSSVTVINNTCNNNEYGFNIYESSSTTVINNTCNNNGESIVIDSSGSLTVANNTCSNSNFGIKISFSVIATVANNTCYNNYDYGIWLWDSDSCNITYNLLQENVEHGVYLDSDSDNNLIHHNIFVDNNLGGTSQAFDDCTNNYWYDTTTLEGNYWYDTTTLEGNYWYDTTTLEGNYWSDWSGTGSYSIDGHAGAFDLYPFDEPVVEVDPPLIVDIIHSPSTPTEQDTISINATITDDSGVQSVTLYYRVNGGDWTEVSMTLITGDIYSVTLDPFAVSDTIEYYVSAVDNSINHNLAINTNAGLYYSFTVSEVIPEFQMFSVLLPAITFLFLICGLVVLQRRKK